MPSIDHVAVYVRDLEATRDFYQRFFGATCNDGYHNPRTGLRTFFLSFDGGVRLEIMSKPGHEESPAKERAGWIHTAFSVGSREEVDAVADRLREAGHVVTSGPRVTGDGCYEAVVLDPEGNEVEFVA
ncbi:hypothetical protein KEM60_01262 [Austwickia sp. TVS 96-490-7B]|uniref:VOC family protein n=1 Tax=Austwickia sp. TVS 96-490-7B TaxID=2830843 RepID=UPI001C57D68E|nr:VOC family protein [Austwickia sp. TVS 96-490-7B]MBW3085070.1 hypothetical protein [Austwickia sp. TVS 96-490-7B]